MSLMCMLKHDWQVLKSASALEMCYDYVVGLKSYNSLKEIPLDVENFIYCPDHIVFEDKVCLRCREKRLDYTRISGLLPELYKRHLLNKEINAKRVKERHEELNREEKRRIELAKEILKEDNTE